jgi:hypothetical protein
MSCGYKCSNTTTSSNGSIQVLNNSNQNIINLSFKSDISVVFNTSFTVEGSVVNRTDLNPLIEIYTSMEDGIISSNLLPTNISIATSNSEYIFTNRDFEARTESFALFYSSCGRLTVIDPSSGGFILEIAKYSFFGPLEARTFNSSSSDFLLSLLPWL